MENTQTPKHILVEYANILSGPGIKPETLYTAVVYLPLANEENERDNEGFERKSATPP